MEVLVKDVHYIQYDSKKFAYCIKAKKQSKRKPPHSRKWLSGLRYSGSFLKISLHVQYSKKKNSD